MSLPPLQSLSPHARIDAVADPGSVAPVDAALAAPRPSPHLARWGIAAQDDDGIAPDIPLREIVRGVIPFLVLMVAAIALLCVVPDIAVWLPNHYQGK